MYAEIIDEDDRGIGVRVVDNNNVKHTVAVGFDGEIQGHSQDGYPDDPAKRTDEENEHNEQARRLARFYVHHERGYDTIPWEADPDRIDAVRVAVESLSAEEFERLFGDLYRHFKSHHDEQVEPVVSIPEDARDPTEIHYQTDIYLGIDPDAATDLDDLAGLASEYDIDLTEPPAAQPDTWTEFTAAASEQEFDFDPAETVAIGAVSEIGMVYFDADWTERRVDPRSPVERNPDARIELLPVESDSLERFQTLLVHHLKCQVRDCFVGMGLTPPEAFQVLGPGQLFYTTRYLSLDMYADYVDPETEMGGDWSGTASGGLRERLFSFF